VVYSDLDMLIGIFQSIKFFAKQVYLRLTIFIR